MLTKKEQEKLLSLRDKEEEFLRYNKLQLFFPEKDTYTIDGKILHSRDKYQKHLEFFKSSIKYKERIFMAGNRVGKTIAGAFEVACHLTGLYPDWWEGKRFKRAVSVWAIGNSNETTRDVIQKELMGLFGQPGSGMIPKDLISDIKPRPNIPNGISYCKVKHVDGNYSELQFKSSEQGVVSFMGTAKDVVWCDEEPPLDVYGECITRLMTTKGIMIVTFTPIQHGTSDVVSSFLVGGNFPEYDKDLNYICKSDLAKEFNKYTVQATWDDVPHLSEEEKKILWDSTPPYLRNARAKGIPAVGVGRIYPVEEENIVIAPFKIPLSWPRLCGLDVGWNRTVAVWGAVDPNTNTTYIYDEYYRGQSEPNVHATAILSKNLAHLDLPSSVSRTLGSWVPVIIDPASRGRSQVDGQSLMDLYFDLGLDVFKANNSVDAGIYTCYNRLSGGKTKFFSTCSNLLQEFRLYHYDKNGKIPSQPDHALDAWRYLEMSIDKAIVFSFSEQKEYSTTMSNSITGY